MIASGRSVVTPFVPVAVTHNQRRQSSDCALLSRHLRRFQNKRRVGCKGFLDQLTDYINGGPKLRKWYGEGDLPVDGGKAIVEQMPEPEDISPEDVERDAVLVTDADSPTGEQVVLQLILARLPVKIITQDAEEAKKGWGPYVTAFAGDVGDVQIVQRALRGVRAVICPGKIGAVLNAAAKARVNHIILLSSAEITQPQAVNFGALFGTEQGMLRDPKREESVQKCGVPFTIVRVGKIQNQPGANSNLQLTQNGETHGEISREDVARVLAGALQAPPKQGLVFQVIASGPGRPPEDWVSTINQLTATTAQ